MDGATSGFQALIVGVSSYSSRRVADLPVSMMDAKVLHAALTDPLLCGYPPRRVQLLTGQEATLDGLRVGLSKLANMGSSDGTTLIYYSGHGARVRTARGWQIYLCPRDTDPNNLPATALSGDEFSDLVGRIATRRLLVILDACHAGSAAEIKSGLGETGLELGFPEQYYEVLSRGEGRVVIASCKEDQVSYVRRQGDLSVFTYHLDKALRGGAAIRGDGYVRILDVFHYLSEALARDEPRQEPVLKAHNVDANFAIALACGGVNPDARAAEATAIARVREQIIRSPRLGALALNRHLESMPHAVLGSAGVDLAVVQTKIGQLIELEDQMIAFGREPTRQSGRTELIHFFLALCLRLERGNAP